MSQGRSRKSLAGWVGLVLFGAMAPAVVAADKPVVVIETSMGNITVELETDKAPKSVANFLKYVDDGQYSNTLFHRVMPGFMIQGGGFDAATKTEKATRASIKNESLAANRNGMTNARGTIAMARTPDPDSATGQWFINVADNKFLDTSGGGYAAFGKVLDGMDVADKIVAVPTSTQSLTNDQGSKGPNENVPVKPVIIKSIKRKGK